jgi:hypothetical protein
VLFSHGPNKTLLVPDSCRVMARNGNSINADITEDTIENYYDACFSYFQTIWHLFWTFCYIKLQCKIIHLYAYSSTYLVTREDFAPHSSKSYRLQSRHMIDRRCFKYFKLNSFMSITAANDQVILFNFQYCIELLMHKKSNAVNGVLWKLINF